ncbi:MAG: glycosyltransferase family 2 protein [Gemmatimonadaceae bacterium]
MHLSLIVCTRDRRDRIGATLGALARLAGARPWELVVVDNGSRDGTAELLRDFAAAAPFPVTIASEPAPGLGRARNAGVAAARGALLAFTDDDCYPAADFVESWCDVFDDPGVGYGGGRILLHDPLDFPITVRTETAPIPLAPGAFVDPGLVQGANMAFRREVVVALGGFDPRLGPGTPFVSDDVDLAARASAAGVRGGYFPGPVVRHHHRRRAPDEVEALRRTYDRGRGAYFAKLLLRPDTRALALRHWYWRARLTPKAAVGREVVGAAHYLARRLVDGRASREDAR